MNIKEKCNNCEFVNLVGKEELKEKEVFLFNIATKEKKYFKILYYVCSNCGRINIVQADTIESEKLLIQIKDITLNLFKKKFKEDSTDRKANAKREKLDKRLKKLRERNKLEIGHIYDTFSIYYLTDMHNNYFNLILDK